MLQRYRPCAIANRSLGKNGSPEVYISHDVRHKNADEFALHWLATALPHSFLNVNEIQHFSCKNLNFNAFKSQNISDTSFLHLIFWNQILQASEGEQHHCCQMSDRLHSVSDAFEVCVSSKVAWLLSCVRELSFRYKEAPESETFKQRSVQVGPGLSEYG